MLYERERKRDLGVVGLGDERKGLRCYGINWVEEGH